MASWQGRSGGGKCPPPPPKFLAVEKLSDLKIFSSKKLSSKNAKFVDENPIFGKVKVEIEIWSTENSLGRKFAASVEKFQFSAPPTFLTMTPLRQSDRPNVQQHMN